MTSAVSATTPESHPVGLPLLFGPALRQAARRNTWSWLLAVVWSRPACPGLSPRGYSRLRVKEAGWIVVPSVPRDRGIGVASQQKGGQTLRPLRGERHWLANMPHRQAQKSGETADVVVDFRSTFRGASSQARIRGASARLHRSFGHVPPRLAPFLPRLGNPYATVPGQARPWSSCSSSRPSLRPA